VAGERREGMKRKINSRDKGKRGELELSHELNNYGFNTRRSQQYCGANGDADIAGLLGIHTECKRVENLNINKAMEQAKKDSNKNDLPTVFHRKNNCKWMVTMELNDWIELYKAYKPIVELQNATQDAK
jgi:hypothetical protein